MFQQPDRQLLMNNIYYSQWNTSQNILKNIQHEHRFRKLNTLPVNETQLKTKQFPFNIVHLITLIHSTFCFLQQAKVAASDCKMKQFLLQANGLQIFSREKVLPSFYFSIFKLQQQNAWAAPQTYDLSVSRTFHILLSIFSSYAHDQLGNCQTFSSFKHFIFFYVVCYAFMNYLVTNSSFGSVPLSPWQSDQSLESTCK